jgi:hypothetical protein
MDCRVKPGNEERSGIGDQQAKGGRLDADRRLLGISVYFLRERLFSPGPALEKKEWVQFIGSIVIFMLGTANVRLAAMRARQQLAQRHK